MSFSTKVRKLFNNNLGSSYDDKVNVGKVFAEIVLKNGNKFEAAEIGYIVGEYYREADMDLFFSRRERNGFINVDSGIWIPREEIQAINITILDHEV